MAKNTSEKEIREEKKTEKDMMKGERRKKNKEKKLGHKAFTVDHVCTYHK